MFNGVNSCSSLIRREGDLRRAVEDCVAGLEREILRISDSVRSAVSELEAVGCCTPDTLDEPAEGGLTLDEALERARSVCETLRALIDDEVPLATQLQRAAIAEEAARAAVGSERARGARFIVRILDTLFRIFGRVPHARRLAALEEGLALLVERRANCERVERDLLARLDQARDAGAAAIRLVVVAGEHATATTLTGARDLVERARAQHAALPLSLFGGWRDVGWERWSIRGDDGLPQCYVSPRLRLGVRESTSTLPDEDSVVKARAGREMLAEPVFAPLIGDGRTLIISSSEADRATSLSVLQSAVIRIAVMMGAQATFTLLDPQGHGASFPFQRFIRSRRASQDLLCDLQEVVEDIQRINRNLLDTDTALHQLPERRLATEQFEFIVAAGFPRGFDRRMIQELATIAEAGPRTGRYVLIEHNADAEMPRDISMSDFRNASWVHVSGERASIDGTPFVPDLIPREFVRSRVFEQLAEAERVQTSIPFDDVLAAVDAHAWTATSEESISTPIGLRGGHDPISLWFGARDGRTCAHGILAGMPGSGKSTLYHVLVMGLASQYSPRELRMYLVDGKFGTEFRPYQGLPHARVVSLNTHPELARSVLKDLVDEMVRRNDLFRAAGVEDLRRYRQSTGRVLERVLLLVDEYQQLFEDDPDGTASELMRRLAQQGRSAGIHMFLGSQRFGTPGMLHRQDIFNNIHLKLAMQLQPDEIIGLTEFGPAGRNMIRACDVAGKFVLNNNGRDEDTISGRCALLDPARRDELVRAFALRAQPERVPPTIVLRGGDPPAVETNELVAEHLRAWDGPEPAVLEKIARAYPSSGPGLGIAGWHASERPVPFVLGRTLSVHGLAAVALRRTVGQNLLVVGSPTTVRLGMLCSGLLSAVALARRGMLAIDVLVGQVDDSDEQLLAMCAIAKRCERARGIGIAIHRGTTACQQALTQIVADVGTRSAAVGAPAQGRIVAILDPDRIPPFLRAPDPFRPVQDPCAVALRRLLAEGPLVGVHVVMASASVRQVCQVIDERRELAAFAHRASLQVGEDDSFILFRNRKGALIQDPADPVSMALYFDVDQNHQQPFRPYAPPVLEGR
jgi:S-DNA-T family DNA segregation ATPase FtsK/SpoIIIE